VRGVASSVGGCNGVVVAQMMQKGYSESMGMRLVRSVLVRGDAGVGCECLRYGRVRVGAGCGVRGA
jgi:hypothetical protein